MKTNMLIAPSSTNRPHIESLPGFPSPTDMVRAFRERVLIGGDYVHPYTEGVTTEDREAWVGMVRRKAGKEW